MLLRYLKNLPAPLPHEHELDQGLQLLHQASLFQVSQLMPVPIVTRLRIP